eukprot:CAMPEP_0194281966 /NCGR_PEP_ID=MMETSP0169-20130528/22046_1 /TAXON_ID=218684 /ORGANISM="Corethron pennatum, Strain L29A3" /LENGTH=194 /DNA_ID=CAMNT_0039027161 /DNA_START=14 /DNA_END=598 /DNA_ORIENTATION=+
MIMRKGLLWQACLIHTAHVNALTTNLTRRVVIFGLPVATVLAPGQATAAADPLETAGSLVSVLKPFYRLEAPLQAGKYDKAAVRATINGEISGAAVVVYSYTLSPFCTEAKNILRDAGATVKVIELGDEWVPGLLPAGGAAVRAELGAMTGQTSMPHIFIGGASIGGLATGTPGLKSLLNSGDLDRKLREAGAL